MSAAGSLIYCSSMAGISDAVNSAQQQGRANTTSIGGVDWDTIQSYNVPYLLFYYLYNPRAGFPLIQVPLLGHVLTLISIALISKRLQCRLPLPNAVTTGIINKLSPESPALSDETKKFHRDRYQDFFSRPKFSRPIPRLFFETKYFRDRYRDFFFRLNIFETDTETFFRD